MKRTNEQKRFSLVLKLVDAKDRAEKLGLHSVVIAINQAITEIPQSLEE
jgi:hypothetical protein